MNSFLKDLMRWSEVWPLLIPLTIFIFRGGARTHLKPIFFYCLIGFLLNLLSTVSWLYKDYMPPFLKENGFLYNLHAIVRTISIGAYIAGREQMKQYKYAKLILYAFVLISLISFIPFEKFLLFSVTVASAESISLLILTLTFFLNNILEENPSDKFMGPVFVICIGLSIYEAVKFFIYLFIFPVFDSNAEFGLMTMKIADYLFITFCIAIGIAVFMDGAIHKENTKQIIYE